MEGLTISWIGALAGLAIAIILILRKLNPVYALFVGAIAGAFWAEPIWSRPLVC